MRKIFFAFIFFFIFLSTSFAENIINGKSYFGTTYSVFGTRHSISYPPGNWQVTKVKKDQNWIYIDFKNYNNNATLYVSIPSTIISGDFWTGAGVKPCKSKNDDGNKYIVHQSGVKRGMVQTTYCIQDIQWSNNSKNFNIKIVAKTTSAPLSWLEYSLYYPLKNSNADALSKKQLKDIGKSLSKALTNNLYGKSGDYSMVMDLLKTKTLTSNNSINSNGDKRKINLMEVNLKHKEKICLILDCNRKESDDADKLQDYITPFLKEGRFYGWPYLAVSKEDMLYLTPAWGMSSVDGNDAIKSCEQYNNGEKCEVIIERGFVVSNKFYRELIKTIPDSNSSGSSNDDIEIIGAGS